MAGTTTSPTPVALNKLKWGNRVMGLIVVIPIQLCNLLFWFFLTPRIIEMLESLQGEENYSPSMWFIKLGKFVDTHSMIALPVFIFFAIWHVCAMCSSNSTQRKLAWITLLAFILGFLILVYWLATSMDIPVLGMKSNLAGHGSTMP